MKKIAFAVGLLLLSLSDWAGTYAQTRYPVVLVPGVLGFAQVFGIDYWYGIPSDLSSNGATVFETSASALNNSVARGEELLGEVQTILAITGAAKVNLIGHSHGGVASRYVAAVIPGQVASVTTIGSPHQGTPVADVLLGLTNNVPALANLAVPIANAFSSLLDTVAGTQYAESAMSELEAMSTPGAAAFNSAYPAGLPSSTCGQGASYANGQHYYSWGGTSVFTNMFDPTDYLFSVTSMAFQNEGNDGLTGQCSSHFGQVLRDDYPWNHGDEVNQFMGLRGWFTPDPVAVIRNQVNRLKNTGL